MIGGTGMIKFIVGLIVGGSLGFIWSGLFRAGGASEEPHKDETVAVVPLKDMKRIMEDHTAFKPRKDFLPGCPHVCANCTHWDHALFAWGAVDFCDVTYRNREAGAICDAIIRSKHE